MLTLKINTVLNVSLTTCINYIEMFFCPNYCKLQTTISPANVHDIVLLSLTTYLFFKPIQINFSSTSKNTYFTLFSKTF